MSRTLLRSMGALVGAGGLLLGTAGAAIAHECINQNRSDQANQQITANSHGWDELTIYEIVTHPFILAQSDAVGQCAQENASKFGLPKSILVHAKTTLAGGNPNMTAGSLANDGKGIDHAEALYGQQLGALVFGVCGGIPPGA